MIGCAPDEGSDRIDVPLTELAITGAIAGLQQGLELPGLGPALVIADMRAQCAHESALLTLGTKIRVYLPDGALSGWVIAGAHETGGEQCRGAQCTLFLGITPGLSDEDDVDVADVIEFAASALAHADHRDAARSRVLGKSCSGDSQAGLEHGIGEIGEPARHDTHRCKANEISCGDAEQLLSVSDAQGIECRDIVG